jgi:hypothetical protein
MAEVETPQVQETGPEETKSETSIQDLMVQMDSLKQAQSGSDRKVKELSDALTTAKVENETLKTEQMNDKEKAQFELDKREQALAEKDALIKAKELAIERTSVLTELTMPQEFAPWVRGSDRTELVENASKLKALFDAKVIEAANANLVSNSTTPKVGDPPKLEQKFESMGAGNSEEFEKYINEISEKKGA